MDKKTTLNQIREKYLQLEKEVELHRSAIMILEKVMHPRLVTAGELLYYAIRRSRNSPPLVFSNTYPRKAVEECVQEENGAGIIALAVTSIHDRNCVILLTSHDSAKISGFPEVRFKQGDIDLLGMVKRSIEEILEFPIFMRQQ